MAKSALITGITGQDGAYLSRLLLEKGYQVHGGVRRLGVVGTGRLTALGVEGDVVLHDFEMLEFSNLFRVLETVAPDEVYNLAAQSFVGVSFEQPLYTSDVDALGPMRLLEAIRASGANSRFYQASTSEMFGKAREMPQNEDTPFHPRSPYGVAKLFAHWATVNYRESHDMFAVSGILFNHESPLRGREFVTRKITSHLAEIAAGERECLELGNLDAKRDWGYAGDYVDGIWRMLQREEPKDFVLATGKAHSVREFAQLAAAFFGFDIEWSGSEANEIGTDRHTGKTIVRVDPQFYRAAEVDLLIGDSSRAEAELGWKRTVNLEQLVAMMCEHDQKLLEDAKA